MTWSKSVYSSHVQEVGWNERDDLLVAWKSGKVSAYSGVPEETALRLANAPSVGGMLASDIKPFFEHRYLR